MRQLGMNEFATLAAGAVGLDNQGHHAEAIPAVLYMADDDRGNWMLVFCYILNIIFRYINAIISKKQWYN